MDGVRAEARTGAHVGATHCAYIVHTTLPRLKPLNFDTKAQQH